MHKVFKYAQNRESLCVCMHFIETQNKMNVEKQIRQTLYKIKKYCIKIVVQGYQYIFISKNSIAWSHSHGAFGWM